MNKYDAMLRDALLDAQKEAWEPLTRSGLELTWTPARQRVMDRLYRDPFGYGRHRARPMWRRAMGRAGQVAACLLLAGTLTLALYPEARAWCVRLLRQWFPTYMDYVFEGTVPADPRPWRLKYIPEGYELVDVFEPTPGSGDVTYENENGNYLVFGYQYAMLGNGGFGIDNEHSDLTSTRVSGVPADLYLSNTDGWPSHLVWSTQDGSVAFHLMAELEAEKLLEIAESVEMTE